MKFKIKMTLVIVFALLSLVPLASLGVSAADAETLSALPNVSVHLDGRQVLTNEAKIIMNNCSITAEKLQTKAKMQTLFAKLYDLLNFRQKTFPSFLLFLQFYLL